MGNRWRMWAGVLAVFLCGMAIGVVGGNLFARYRAARHIARIGQSHGAFLADMVMERLQDRLDLTPAQVAKFKPLLADAYRRGHEQFESIRPKVDAIMKQTVAEMRKDLTREQNQRLDQAHGFRLLLPPPPPPGPPPE